VTGLSVDDNKLILTLDASADAGELVSFSYSGTSIQDASGNQVEAFDAASFVYSSEVWGTLFDTDRDGTYDLMQLADPYELDVEEQMDTYRIVAGEITPTTADYTAQRFVEFEFGGLDASGRPTSFYDDENLVDITWGDTGRGEVATAPLTFYTSDPADPDGPDIENSGTIYFFDTNSDDVFDSMEVWYTPEGESEPVLFASFEVTGYTYDGGDPASMQTIITELQVGDNDYFDFTLDGGTIVLPFEEFGAPKGFEAIALTPDGDPNDDIVATFSMEGGATGYFCDKFEDDGVIDFLELDFVDETDQYYVTWEDYVHWTAHYVENFGFKNYTDERPSTFVIDGDDVPLSWEDGPDNLVATAREDEGTLSFYNDDGDWKPERIRYEGDDGTIVSVVIPDVAWNDDTVPTEGFAYVVETDEPVGERSLPDVFSGRMEVDGEGNPVTILGQNPEALDTTAPELDYFAADAGYVITLQYKELLDPLNLPSADDFAVTVNAAEVNVAGIEVRGSQVVLTLESSIPEGPTINVAYHGPTGEDDANAIPDASGNDAASFERSMTLDGELNHAPTVEGALTSVASEGDAAYELNPLYGANDDDGDELSVGVVTWTVDGVETGNGGTDLPDGVSITAEGMVKVDPTDESFNSLGVGQSREIAASYTISDGHGGEVAQTGTITINGTNDAPTVENAIVDKIATEDVAFTFVVPENTFADEDAGDTLTYTATLADGGDLPEWLSFDPSTREFSGTPANGDIGPIEVKVTATDGSESVSDMFTLTVNNVNDAPTLEHPEADQTAEEYHPFSYEIPADTFDDVDAGDTLTYSATLADGGDLPDWAELRC